MNNITLVTAYPEGATVYKCGKCNHTFTVPKGKEEVKCNYCGNIGGDSMFKNSQLEGLYRGFINEGFEPYQAYLRTTNFAREQNIKEI
jgi:hypothetical protein